MGKTTSKAKPSCSWCAGRGWIIARSGWPTPCACLDQSSILTRALRKAEPRRFTGQAPTGFGLLES